MLTVRPQSASRSLARRYLLVCIGTGNPEPEGGAKALALGGDAYLTHTAVSDGLADGEAEASALDEVVELDEAFEDGGLLLLRDAGTRVLAIEIEAFSFAPLLLTVASWYIRLTCPIVLFPLRYRTSWH